MSSTRTDIDSHLYTSLYCLVYKNPPPMSRLKSLKIEIEANTGINIDKLQHLKVVEQDENHVDFSTAGLQSSFVEVAHVFTLHGNVVLGQLDPEQQGRLWRARRFTAGCKVKVSRV